jgi:hypothetical protein
VDFVNNILVGGLAEVVIVSLGSLLNEVDPAQVKKFDKSPMIEISMDLQASRVVFQPNLLTSKSKKNKKKDGSVRGILDGWINSFFKPSTIVKRLDGSGTFTKELQNGMHVRAYINRINKAFNALVEDCNKFKASYKDYSHLWEKDMQTTFDEFLVGATTETTDAVLLVVNLPEASKYL